MRIGVLGTGRIGLMHARNLAQTAGVDEVVLMGRDPDRLAVAVKHVSTALQPDAPSELAGDLDPRGPVAKVTAGAGLPEELHGLGGVVVATSTVPIRRSPWRSRALEFRRWWRSRSRLILTN